MQCRSGANLLLAQYLPGYPRQKCKEKGSDLFWKPMAFQVTQAGPFHLEVRLSHAFSYQVSTQSVSRGLNALENVEPMASDLQPYQLENKSV